MFYQIKKYTIRIISVSVLFYVLWLVLNKVSPTVNPHEVRTETVERDYRGAIDVDFKQNELH